MPASSEGDEIGTSYDPMIAKLIAYGADARARRSTGSRARSRETEVGGVTTNLPFLRWLVAHPLVRAGRDDDRVPHREPAALGAAAARTGRGLERAWRLNLPAPPPRPAPDVDDAGGGTARAVEQAADRRADARAP